VFTLHIWPVAVGRRDDNHRNSLAVLLWDAAVLLRHLDQDQHLEVAAHFHRQGLIRLAQGAGAVPGYLGGLSCSRLICLQLSSHITPALAWRFASEELA